MKLKVSQLVYGNLVPAESWFSRFVEPINAAYCKLHGYNYVVERINDWRKDRHGNWEKIQHVIRNLYDCDYLFFLDADAVFYSFVIAIHEEILPLLGEKICFLVTTVEVKQNDGIPVH